MIQLTTSQTLWLIGYTVLFGLLLGAALNWAEENKIREKNHTFLYLGFFLAMQILFFLGMSGVFAIFAHTKSAFAFLLIKHKLSDVRLKYEKMQTEKLTADEAKLVQQHFQFTVPIEGFYQYNLVNEEDKSLKTFYSANSDLLQYLKNNQSIPLALNEEDQAPLSTSGEGGEAA